MAHRSMERKGEKVMARKIILIVSIIPLFPSFPLLLGGPRIRKEKHMLSLIGLDLAKDKHRLTLRFKLQIRKLGTSSTGRKPQMNRQAISLQSQHRIYYQQKSWRIVVVT